MNAAYDILVLVRNNPSSRRVSHDMNDLPKGVCLNVDIAAHLIQKLAQRQHISKALENQPHLSKTCNFHTSLSTAKPALE
jgi:hypothetical protein